MTPPVRSAAGERPTAGSGLRVIAARGTIVNGAFLMGVNALALLRGFLVAAFLSTTEYGVWGIVVVVVATLTVLKQVGIGEKYVQQDEADQEVAFQRAMTLELILAAILVTGGLALVPLMGLAFGTPEIIGPGLVALLALPAHSLQAPLWIFYRELDFVRQRKLQAIDPIVAFVVAIALLIAGAGYWSLIVGIVVGAWSGALIALRANPHRLRWDFHRPTLRSYASFSWPLFLPGLAVIVVGQGLVIVGEAELGLAGVGVIALTATISQYSDRADQAVTQTIYPTICAVKDRADLLYEAFIKSNRLALMWGAPFGLGLALFASDLVEFGLGDRWEAAVELLQAVGVAVAIRQIGFNWHAFYRAQGDTRPIGVAAVAGIVAFLVLALPALIAWGLTGLAVATILMELVSLAVRTAYLRRLFATFSLPRHALRALAPSLPAVGAVLGLRAAVGPAGGLGEALAVFALYVAVTALATAVLERSLVREILAYLRGRSLLERPVATP